MTAADGPPTGPRPWRTVRGNRLSSDASNQPSPDGWCGLFFIAGKKGLMQMAVQANQNGQPPVPPPGERVALVTGGNRGIGKEIARQLSLMGMTVLIGCRDEARGKDAAAELAAAGAPVRPEVVDVGSRRSIEGLMKRIEETYGRLDVLVNNAAVLLDRG